MIRKARRGDLPGIFNLLVKAHEESHWKELYPICDSKLRNAIRTFLTDDRYTVLLTEHGVAIGMEAYQWFSTTKSFQEVLVYVLPDFRKSGEATALLEGLMADAQERKVKDIVVGQSLHPDKIEAYGKYLAKFGFAPHGASFRKEF